MPTALHEPSPAKVEHPTAELTAALGKVTSGQELYRAENLDPVAVTRKLLADHPDAHMEKNGHLTLPAIPAAEVSQARTTVELGRVLAHATGVSRVTVEKVGERFHVYGHINPKDKLADLLNEVSHADLKRAKAEFRTRLFDREELIDFLGVSDRTTDSRISDWKEAGVLFTNESCEFDCLKMFTFSEAKAGERPLADNESNRYKYGFVNPAKDSKEGIEILEKGWVKSSSAPPASSSRYVSKGEYKNFESAYKTKSFSYAVAILGHKEGASVYWNRIGHKKPRSDNQTWNRDPAQYVGPEHKTESARSGSESPHYKIPTKKLGSHPSWWE